MPRARLPSKANPGVLLRSVGLWLNNCLPVRVMRLFWLMLWHREDGLTGALAGWLPYRIRPLVYLATASIVFGGALSIHPVYRSAINWFDVLAALDPKDSLAVWDELELPDNLLDTVNIENFLPNASPASKVIKDRVGSDDGLKFSLYIGTIDSRLGSILVAKAILLQKINGYEDKTTDLVLPFILQAAIFPLYILGNTRKRSKGSISAATWRRWSFVIAGTDSDRKAS